jgi:hypothetical protein
MGNIYFSDIINSLMALKDIQCYQDGCGGMVQITVDSDEEVTKVSGVNFFSTPHYREECPECGSTIGIKTS